MINNKEITIEEIENFLEKTKKCKCLDKDMFDNYCINSADIDIIEKIIKKMKRLEARNKELEEYLEKQTIKMIEEWDKRNGYKNK